MDIKNLKDLSKIIDLCRKKGIESVKIGSDAIELTFKANSEPRPYRRKAKGNELPTEMVDTPDAFNELDALFWSSAGLPQDGVN